MKENGYNWMSACGMYVFAGFFAVHGWPCSGWLTWVLWGILFRCQWYISGHDLMTEVHPKIAWMFSTFRMRSPIRARGRMILPGGHVTYACPLTFLWGAVTLYAFAQLPFSPSMSKILFFIGGKEIFIHFFDMHLTANWGTAKWTRRNELSKLPWIRFKNLVLTTIQIGNLGFFLEIFRDRLFTKSLQLMQTVFKWVMKKRNK
jgi:hypothetical protein